MKKQTKLVIKIERLLKKLNCREYLHHFGPKKFKFVHHACALLLKETLKCSFRRISKFLDLVNVKVPTYSALCKSRKRIPVAVWQKLLTLTAGISSGKVAIDGTGFSRTNPSYHYIKRIDRRQPIKNYGKLSALFDVVKKKFLRLRTWVNHRHDIKDAKPLVAQLRNITKLYGDKGYDAEELHRYCYWKKIQTVIPKKKNVKHGWARKKQQINFTEEDYHQRSLIESGFGSLKRKYGGFVLAKKAKAMKVEIYCKAISHNLDLMN